jgi:serine/threonine protein kinase
MSKLIKQYEILHQIGIGSFGVVYKGKNIRTDDYVAIKTQPINDYQLLKHESSVYYYLNRTDGIPQLKWFGKDDNYYYMVIQLFGNSLNDLIRKEISLSLQLTLSIGIQILKILSNIHEKGVVHRDIKPDNFLFEIGIDTSSKIYLIDFGLCKSYVNREKKHIQMKKINGLIGSKNYASLNSHNHYELSRRDDLESLCYILLYLYNGKLLWENIEDENKIIQLKQNISSGPTIILELLKYVRNLKFTEKPNYQYIIDKFLQFLTFYTF